MLEAQVDGWILQHAHTLVDAKNPARKHAGYAILMLIVSYFEGIEPFIAGSKAGKPHEVFRSGLRQVFPELSATPDLAIDSIYGELRCGLYHEGATGPRIQIARTPKPIIVKTDPAGNLTAAVFNPWRVLKRVDSHFHAYIKDLRNPAQQALRGHFTKYRKVGQILFSFAPQRIVSTFR